MIWLAGVTIPKAVTIEAPAGSIVVFSSLILHATGANRTKKLRRVYLAQYTAEAMLNAGTRELRNDAVPILQRGERATVA
jgi:ectoine hydroxylase-related dioxygenase (phytanoyl-CoA dioxygenase family)